MKKLAKKSKKTASKGSLLLKKEKPIGKVTHYFGKIKVAVIKLSSPIKKGDLVRVSGGDNTDFEQKIESMQVDYKDVKIAKKGKSVGLKIKKKVREGYKIFKV